MKVTQILWLGIVSLLLSTACYQNEIVPFADSPPTVTPTAVPMQTEQPTNRLVAEDEPGEPLQLRLTIRAANGGVPIAGAELWLRQTGDNGRYEEDADGVPLIEGTFLTDTTGVMEVITILPGRYPEDPTASRHIHLSVQAAGYEPVERVILFENDPYLTADERAFRFALVAKMTPLADGTWLAEATLQLEPEPTAGVETSALLALGHGGKQMMLKPVLFPLPGEKELQAAVAQTRGLST